MKNSAQLFVAFAISFLSFLANAEIVKVPVDPSVTAASGVPGYDPTVMSSSSGPGLYVQSSDVAAASSGGTFSTQGTVGTLSTSIGQLLRWPALPKYTYFQTISNNRAYYRDAFTAITYTADASPGTFSKTWDVKGTIVPTSGKTTEFDWPTMTFYPQVAGYPYCFYTPGWAYYICGSTSIYITAYTNSQCQPYGNWTFAVSEDGGLVGQKSFTMLGEVPPEDLTLMSQSTSHTYDSICYSSTSRLIPCNASSPPVGATPYTISQKGCALTSIDMVMAYHGYGTDVGSLNDAVVSLGEDRGFNRFGDVVWPFPGDVTGGQVAFIQGTAGSDDSELKQNICKYGPQVMGVKVNVDEDGRIYIGHWVTVVGRTEDDSAWKIYDPAGRTNTLAGYPYFNTYGATRIYKGQQVTYVDLLNQVFFQMFSPAELLITDPSGKKTGVDPISHKSYNGIPKAFYVAEGLDDDETGQVDTEPTKIAGIASAAEGPYTLQVTGTGIGTYTLQTSRYDASGRFQDVSALNDIPITPGEVHTYSVNYSISSAAAPTYGGGFCGRSNNPDVNKFLCYGNPSQATTTLPSGTTNFRFMITYGSTTTPSTFSASINGLNVSNLFSPAPGKTETVYLPLASGKNVLELAISGSTPTSRTATDSDRLIFSVQ